MTYLKKAAFLILILALTAGCKRKKVSLSGQEPVEVSDFIESFELVKLPYQLTDSLVTRKEDDSLLISYKVFTQFIPDTILTPVFGKSNPKIYPMARIEVKNKETYLFAKGVQGDKKAAFIISLDNKNAFAAAMPILRPDQWLSTQQVSGIDKRYSIYKTLLRKNADASISEGKEVYVYNEGAKAFTLIMTDALDEGITELINPIDTLPKKNKFSADYAKNKNNLVSIRDNKKTDRVTFFINIDDGEDCKGELKGEAKFIAANIAEYRQNGEPCSLQFLFTATTVTVKELEGCGSRRGMNCSFNGSFTRKKEPKQKIVRKNPVKK